jgi:RNA polymerase sigma factor (sigma-70 family)
MESAYAAAAAGSERSDAELLAAVRAGDQAAYGVLWTRHEGAARNLARQLARANDIDELVSESFYRVLRAITTGGGPDGAFRAYLLSTLRRVNIDTGRSYYQRVTLTEDDRDLEIEHADSAADVAMEQNEQSAAWRAWASLPESTRTLLWHLVIEEETPAQIASLLGTSPNGVSSRAVRAKERLRQAFLQQHVLDADSERCDWTRRRLGEYVRHALSNRDLAAVEDHLSGCERCTAAAAEVGDVNQTLRVMVAPVVLGGALAAAGYFKAAGAGHAAHAGAGHGILHTIWHAPVKLALATTGVVAVGATATVLAVAVSGSPHHAAIPPSVVTSSSAPASTVSTIPVTTSSSARPSTTPTPTKARVSPTTPARTTPRTSAATTPSTTLKTSTAPTPTSTPTTPTSSAATKATSTRPAPPAVTVNLPELGVQDSGGQADVDVEVAVPSGWTVVLSGPAGGSCSAQGATAKCHYNLLPKGDYHDFRAVATGPTGSTGSTGRLTGNYLYSGTPVQPIDESL